MGRVMSIYVMAICILQIMQFRRESPELHWLCQWHGPTVTPLAEKQ